MDIEKYNKDDENQLIQFRSKCDQYTIGASFFEGKINALEVQLKKDAQDQDCAKCISDVANFSHLESLYLFNFKFVEIPSEIVKLKHLKILHIREAKIIPLWLDQLPNLEDLHIAINNTNIDIPKYLFHLPNLKEVDFGTRNLIEPWKTIDENFHRYMRGTSYTGTSWYRMKQYYTNSDAYIQWIAEINQERDGSTYKQKLTIPPNSVNAIWKLLQKEYRPSIGHSFSHTQRVLSNAMMIAPSYDGYVNLDLLKTMVILHDIKRLDEELDNSGSTDHAIEGAREAQKILLHLGYDAEFSQRVADGIRTHRFRSDDPPASLEARILFDADKLDTIGAIGIARCFMSAGMYQQEIYRDLDLEVYKKENIGENGRIKDLSKHTPFFEWQLKFQQICDHFLTPCGKELAQERFAYMHSFFDQLKKDIG